MPRCDCVNCRYAYSALADGADDEAEEPMMSEAFGKQTSRTKGECRMIDKVGRLLWAWFSCPGKSADKINEHIMVNIFVCYFVQYQLA